MEVKEDDPFQSPVSDRNGSDETDKLITPFMGKKERRYFHNSFHLIFVFFFF